jgi:hypothetical protein
MAMTYVPVVGFFVPDGLALPATQLIKNGGASAPIGVFPAMREQLGDLLPTWRGLGPLPLEGLSDGLAGNPELQGEAPGVQRMNTPARARSLPWLSIIPKFASSPADGPLLGHDC